MFRQLDDFLKAYKDLAEGTGRMLQACDDGCLDQGVSPGHRTIGQLAWHIVTTVPEMMNRTGLGLSSVDPASMPPRSAAEIASNYQAAASELTEAVRSKWNDRTLLEEDDMYGESWPRGTTLAALIQHEVHHRAQMTVLLRQAGRDVPGVFGPAKQEWAQFGMEAPPY